MKTSVLLQSTDRVLFDTTIKQDTKSQFLSLTDLQSAYETARWQYGWSDRKVSDVVQTMEFRQRLFYILENKGIIKTNLSGFIEMIEKEGFVRTVKGLGIWKATGARGTNQVSCDPYVWVLIAMEMNPMIYAKVVLWLTDSLVFNRIEAGDEFMPMNAAIKTILGAPDYGRFAKAINEKVFGHHQFGMRNLASAKELRKISDIEKFVKNAIESGWLKSEHDIMSAIISYK
jgi:hypothetical protein